MTKNDYLGLLKTLESAKSQTDQDFRHLVVDGSTKSRDVKKLVSQYRAEYCWAPPKGIYPAMEMGLEKLDDSDYCWFLNSSDTFADENSVSLVNRKLVTALDSKKVWGVGKVLLVDKNSSTVYGPPISTKDLIVTARKGQLYFPHSSTIISVSKMRAVDPFAENLEIAQDYLISLKILTRFGPPAAFEEVLSNFEIGGVTSQRTVATGLEAVKARMIVFGPSQTSREMWNVIRIIFGRPVKKMWFVIRSKFSVGQ